MTNQTALLRNQKAATPPTPEEVASLGLNAEYEWLWRDCVLANGSVDRDFERFSPALLADFARTLPGRSLLVGHDTSGLPEGTFIRATTQLDAQGIPELAATFGIPVLPDDEHNAELRGRVESGIAKFVSIGFTADTLLCDVCGEPIWGATKCSHFPGEKLTDGTVVTATWQSPGETREGSIVYLGSQYGAELKSADPPEALHDHAYTGLHRTKSWAPDGALVLSHEDLVSAAVRIAGARGADGLTPDERKSAWLDVQRGYKALGLQVPRWSPGRKFAWSDWSEDDRRIYHTQELSAETSRMTGLLGRIKGAAAYVRTEGGPLPPAAQDSLAACRDLAEHLLGETGTQGAKVGRALSGANETALREALAACQACIDALNSVLGVAAVTVDVSDAAGKIAAAEPVAEPPEKTEPDAEPEPEPDATPEPEVPEAPAGEPEPVPAEEPTVAPEPEPETDAQDYLLRAVMAYQPKAPPPPEEIDLAALLT